jgi:outer membrane protein OmpA-like peptidoglycan-associated protein
LHRKFKNLNLFFMKKTLLILTMTALTVAGFAQNASNRWNVSAGVGFTDFINPIHGQYLMFERYKGTFNANIQRYLGKSFDGRFNFSQGSVFYPTYSGAEANGGTKVPNNMFLVEQNGIYDLAEMWGGSLNLVYKLANGYILNENAKVAPYLFSGLGATLFNSIGRQQSAGLDNVNPYIPAGLGFMFNITDRWNLGLETSYNFALGESYDYTLTNVRLGHNFGSGVPAATAATSTATAYEMPNQNWCSRDWSVGAGASFVSFEGPMTGQNFLLDQFTTLASINLQKRLNSAFDARINGAFGNVWYPKQVGGDNYPNVNDNVHAVSYNAAQMFDLTLEGVLKGAGTILPENAIFSPYIYAGPGINWITSIGNWNAGNNGVNYYGTDDVNMNISSGLGFNFRTSDRFSIQLEGGRKWNLDNSFSYNQANLRGVYALGNCNTDAPKKASKTEAAKVQDSDGDGVPDNVDECPYVAGRPEFFGCPDSDGDGIGDSKDKCPFDKGPASNQGCPEAAKPAETTPTTPTTPSSSSNGQKQGRLIGTYEVFFTNCNTYSAGQVETLQQVATLLKNNPNYKATVNGHAAKGGSKACSQQRADKVAGTLKMKGVNVSGVKTAAFGDARSKYNSTQDNRAEIEIYSFD